MMRVVAVGSAVTLGAAACSSDSGKAALPAAGGQVEAGALPAPDPDIEEAPAQDDPQNAAPTATFTVDDAQLVLGESLPEGFPEDEIPLVPGPVVSAIGMKDATQSGFTVILTPSGDGGVKAAADLLVAAGFTVTGSIDGGGTSTRILTSTNWDLVVSWASVEGEQTMTYSVTSADS